MTDQPPESGGSPTPTGWVKPRNAARLVLGDSRRGGVQAITTGPGVGSTITRLSGDIDVHRVSHERIGKGRVPPSLADDLRVRRLLLGSIFALAVHQRLTLGLRFDRSGLNLTSDVLVAVVIVAMVGGSWPGITTAVVGGILNYYFFPPLHTFRSAEANNDLALGVFVAVAAMASRVVDIAARRISDAMRAAAEAETLSSLAGSVLRGQSVLPALLVQVGKTYGMASASFSRGAGMVQLTCRRASTSTSRSPSTGTAGTSSPLPVWPSNQWTVVHQL